MLEHLLSPVRIGSLELKNRVAMAPMGVEIAEADGMVREPVVRYYEERARGGVGLLISENTCATYPRGANSAHELGVSDDAFLPGLQSLTRAVHAHGAKIALQLAHHGKVARLDIQQGRELLMPSIPLQPVSPGGPLDLAVEEMQLMAKALGGGRPQVRAATREDLEQLTADFVDATDRARRAGFDAVELHGAHGYIFSEFLSPASNFRDDEYGGTIENRSRLLCEVLRACKERVGEDFPIWCRIDATEFEVTNGIRFADARRTAELAVEAGAAAISVSAYADPMGAGFTLAPIVHKEAGFADFAAGIKERVDVPVIAAGRIEPEVGDRLVRDGKADVIAMGRKLLADPELVSKLEAGRSQDVRPCIYCYVCVAQAFFDRHVRCAVNAMAARESELAERFRSQAAEPKRVLIVGAGPAGMEAARVAALRGHDVVLCEKSQQLGGTLRFAALPYEPNERLLRFFEAQMRALPIDVRLGNAVTADTIREIAPDVVIAAVGPLRSNPEIPGIDKPHVMNGDDLRSLLSGDAPSDSAARLSLLGRVAVGVGRATGITDDPSKLRSASKTYMPLGQRIAILGGGLVGSELAEFLAERRREVVLIEAGPIMAAEMAHPRRWRVLYELRKAGVRLLNGAQVVSIGDDSLTLRTRGPDGGETEQSLGIDNLIVATGLQANPGAVEPLRSAGVPVIAIGDGNEIGYIEGAIRSGFDAALAL